VKLTTHPIKELVELYLHSPNTPSWRGAQLKNAEAQILRPNMILRTSFRAIGD